jgi:AraC-like DNA-binding protein
MADVIVLLDQLARGCTVALLVTLGIVLLRDLPRSLAAWTACGLFASIASYLVRSSPDYTRWWILDSVLGGAALAAPAAFWFFSRAFFGDEEGFDGWDAGVVVALVAVGFGRPAIAAETAYDLGGVVLVGLALSQVVRGLPADLVERRRRFRAVFTFVVGVGILIILGAERLLGGRPAPRLLELFKSVTSLGLTALFSAWLLTPRRDLLAVATKAPVDPSPDVSAAAESPDSDARFRERLLAVMRDERLYRQERLTIGAVARKLDRPEYRVRRIINQQLGHRNFNAFLNELRTAEACRILADPAQERLPIFNLALDLGYGSLGPFNRAFRAKTGQTPTEYRRTHLERPTATPLAPAES